MFEAMTIVEKSNEQLLDDVQKGIDNLNVTSNEKTNTIKHSLAPRRYAGRCSIELGEVTQHNVMQVKRLNEAVFPVTYNDRFYDEVVDRSELAKIAYFNDCVVGAVCCRIEMKDQSKNLYIMTLGALAPYRRVGIGSLLLNFVFELCDKDPLIKRVILHVQSNNDIAVKFYEHFGFMNTGLHENYYKKITPASALVLEKPVNCFDA